MAVMENTTLTVEVHLDTDEAHRKIEELRRALGRARASTQVRKSNGYLSGIKCPHCAQWFNPMQPQEPA